MRARVLRGAVDELSVYDGPMRSERVEGFRTGELVAGGLRVEALLGQGGTGAVYRVKDERSGRKLALKQLQPPVDERRALVTPQFEREYHTLAQLAHPRIIEVHDYGFEHGSAYYTMELLDGDDLHERGKLPWQKACALLCEWRPRWRSCIRVGWSIAMSPRAMCAAPRIGAPS